MDRSDFSAVTEKPTGKPSHNLAPFLLCFLELSNINFACIFIILHFTVWVCAEMCVLQTKKQMDKQISR